MSNIPDWLKAELQNWSRWCWSGPYPHPLPPDHCYSIESNYVRFREENTTAEAPQPKPNERNALIVNRVYKSLPKPQQKALVAEYPQHHKYKTKAAAVRGTGFANAKSYDQELFKAISKVWSAFDTKHAGGLV